MSQNRESEIEATIDTNSCRQEIENMDISCNCYKLDILIDLPANKSSCLKLEIMRDCYPSTTSYHPITNASCALLAHQHPNLIISPVLGGARIMKLEPIRRTAEWTR